MCMKDIESVGPADGGHPDSERKRVIGKIEDPVSMHLHGMKRDTWIISRQPDWTIVAEKVHLMSLSGEFQAQRCGKNPASTD